MIVSGKLRAQRAKSMKFKDGYMVSSGNPVREYIDSATRHVLLRQVRRGCRAVNQLAAHKDRHGMAWHLSFLSTASLPVVAPVQGVLGIKVRIMKEWDPTGKVGPRTPLPDVVTVLAPKVSGRRCPLLTGGLW